MGARDRLLRTGALAWLAGASVPALAQPTWELVPDDTSRTSTTLSWERVPEGEQISADDPPTPAPAPDTTTTAAAALGPPLRLGWAVPTANRLDDAQLEVQFNQTWADGSGESVASGNQNYSIRADFGLSPALMVSGFVSYADDPLYATIANKPNPLDNYWLVIGGAARLRLAGDNAAPFQVPRWELALEGSLEQFSVGSGCGGSSNCGSPDSDTANIFNPANRVVFTRNLVSAINLPFSWRASSNLQLSFSPGISLLPASQGGDQGGSGPFYGTNVTVAAGASWRPIPQLELLGSGLLPLGPGTNSFNSNLAYSRVPIFSLGANVIFNPRISLQGALTNGFGTTPATALLALPSDNRLLYSASFRWKPDQPDTPMPPLSARQRALSLGGLSVNTGWVPPAGSWQVSATADSRGNLFGYLGWSASNIFQFDLFNGGVFNDVEPVTPLVQAYANNGGVNTRIGGKLMAFNQLRGAPFTGAGRISLGRNNDASFQGYLFGEWMGTWEANHWLAFNLGPKVGWSGVASPWGLGMGANIQLARQWQLIPEFNLALSDSGSSNGSVALRWLASQQVSLDLYVSNAAGLYDIGTLLRSEQLRLGTRLSLLF